MYVKRLIYVLSQNNNLTRDYGHVEPGAIPPHLLLTELEIMALNYLGDVPHFGMPNKISEVILKSVSTLQLQLHMLFTVERLYVAYSYRFI